MSTLRTNTIESLDGQSLATVEDLATINKRTIYVGSMAELEGLSPADGNQANIAGSNAGAFEFSSDNLSTEVADDTNLDFFIAPDSDATGASGAWVRKTGLVISGGFSQYAPDSSLLFSSVDERLYIRAGGEWVSSDEYLKTLFDTHTQSGDAHGLGSTSLEIGSNNTTGGSLPVTIGHNILNDSSSFLLGRDISSNTQFVAAMGRDININVGGANSNREHVVIGNVLGESGDSGLNILLGHYYDLNNVTNTVVLAPNASADIHNETLYSHRGVVIGQGARIEGASGAIVNEAVALGPSSRASAFRGVAIGRAASAAHDNSVALGANVSTTASDQIMLGDSSRTIEVPGNLNVSGTKNFSIPHPVPEKKDSYKLRHASYEGPVPGGTIYRYTVETVNGECLKELPDYFKYLNKDAQVWCSPKKHFGQAYGEIEENALTVTSNQDGKYEVLILATRRDDGVSNWEGSEVINGDS